MKSFSIYIIDDHNLFLESIEAFLGLQEQFNCVGHAKDIDAAFKDIVGLKPDIIFIDYHLNETNGFELLKKIKEANLDCISVILTMRRDAQIRNRAKEMGAQGYLLKSMGAEDLIHALNEIVSLKTGFYDSIEEDLKAKGAHYRNLLTAREMQIAKMVTQGISSEKIAEQLDLSLYTVNSHRKNILRKLNAKNPIDLMNYLREIGEI
ncbi:MAG: response regulator [Bacteroidota bacterium]|jgi:DNA-binding NarL/FixJ family response regulator